jgi:hypothetical protein
MNGLGDSLTIGILLTLIFGAACFYLYSRLSQNEKRVSLLENLLLNLKMSTEASMMGPDMVEPTSSPAPLETGDVDEVSEVEYADILKGIPAVVSEVVADTDVDVNANANANANAQDEEVLLRSAASVTPVRKMDANYESMSLKELQALARQRGLNGIPSRKRELVDALKKQGGDVPLAPSPLSKIEGELEGATSAQGPFQVDIEQSS